VSKNYIYPLDDSAEPHNWPMILFAIGERLEALVEVQTRIADALEKAEGK